MSRYSALLRHCRLPEIAALISEGTVRVPSEDAIAPVESAGFPPALIPLWQESGPVFVGFWQHFFVARATTIVRLSPEDDYRVEETARNASQLVLYAAVRGIVEADGISPEVRAFAELAGITHRLSALDSLTRSTGDDPIGLVALPEFADDPPRACRPKASDYKGDFPIGSPRDTTLRSCCTVELTREMREHVSKVDKKPPWFEPQDQAATFSQLLRAGDTAGAWLSLNSNGWTFSRALAALRELAVVTRSADVDELSKAWIAHGHDLPNRY